MNAPFQEKVEQVHSAINAIIIGKPEVTKLALCCFLAGGHLLINDIPGVGKTTLAQSMSRLLGLDFRRIQFTNDLMPSDLTGVTIFDRQKNAFVFHPGPIHTGILLADEINRANPKTQSALLEAMEERQVTVDGVTYALPIPFFVLATQNPDDQMGTFALPESQLDRFLMEMTIGYPDPQSELNLLKLGGMRPQADELRAILNAELLLVGMKLVAQVHADDAILSYVLRLIQATREHSDFRYGLSPRAGISMVKAAKSYALLSQRNFLLPDDVQAIFVPCAAHRIKALRTTVDVRSILQDILKHIKV